MGLSQKGKARIRVVAGKVLRARRHIQKSSDAQDKETKIQSSGQVSRGGLERERPPCYLRYLEAEERAVGPLAIPCSVQ